MNSHLLGLILACICFTASGFYPAEYDLRFEPDYRLCSFDVSEEGLCSANWGIIIAEVLSNMYCLKQQKAKFLLSSQNLIDCTPYDQGAVLEKCQLFGSNTTFFNALNYLQKYGITTDACYPYGSIITGDEYSCQSKCQDGSAITEVYKATYTNLTSTNQVKDYLLYEGPVVVLIEAYDELLHYQMQDSEYVDEGSANYDSDLGYRALKIVGWMTNNNTEYWVAGNSWGRNWAVNGYMYLQTDSTYIQSYHGLQIQ